ncbi:MAG: S16 family serine protease [Candidatus Hadarchaeum sp.]|uniref:S16 family serine protease n=2 Tax=Candidatus Hadarchaeum sp. TaxID=2883567 RepID=UPI00316D76C8
MMRKKNRIYLIAVFVAALAFVGGTVFGISISNLGKIETQAKVMGLENSRSSSIAIVAVSANETGALLNLNVEVRPGTGEIYVNTAPLVEADFQYAQWIAVSVAANYLGLPVDDDNVGIKGLDISFSVSSDEPIQLVGGPSAGAAMTVLTIAVLDNKQVKNNVVITGEINDDGSIGKVGGLIAKLEAAEKAGKELFLVPPGQSNVIVYKQVAYKVGPFTKIMLEPVTVNLNEYAENMGWKVKVQEVSTIQEAITLMLE